MPKGSPEGQPPPRSRAGAAARTIGLFVAMLWLVELIDLLLLGGRLDGYGVEPRDLDGLDGVVLAPLLHAGLAHLTANTVPLLVLGFLVLLSGVARWAVVTLVVWVVGGAGTWLTGAERTVHLGASGLIFGWLTYPLLRGVFSRSMRQILLGVVVLILYGGLLLGVLPGTPGVSWQGHLFGAVGGVCAAIWLGRRDRTAADARKA